MNNMNLRFARRAFALLALLASAAANSSTPSPSMSTAMGQMPHRGPSIIWLGKCSTTICTRAAMLCGCRRTQPMMPFMAALRSTSVWSYSLPSCASLKASL